MTKQAEIESLRRYTGSLPRDSYLRPWLEYVLPEVEADIRNDFPVAPSLTVTRHESRKMIEAATIEAQAIVAAAVKKAKALEQDEQAKRTHWRNQFAGELRTMLHTIGY